MGYDFTRMQLMNYQSVVKLVLLVDVQVDVAPQEALLQLGDQILLFLDLRLGGKLQIELLQVRQPQKSLHKCFNKEIVHNEGFAESNKGYLIVKFNT